MVCSTTNVKKAFETSLKRADTLLLDMRVTREGEDLAATKANAEKALEILGRKDFGVKDLQSVDRSPLLNNAATVLLRRELTDSFQAAISTVANSKSERSTFVLKTAEYKNGNISLVVSPEGQDKYWTYTFDSGSNKSLNTVNGNRLFIPGFNQVYNTVTKQVDNLRSETYTEANAEAHRVHVDSVQALMSDDVTLEEAMTRASSYGEGKFDYKKATEVKGYDHENIQHMRDMLMDLHAVSGNSVDNETFSHYNKLLDAMHPHFFRKMKLFINENEDHTQGWVDIDKEHILLNTSSKTHNGMSNAEVYMHETIHTMTLWGLQKEDQPEVKKLKNRLNYLMNQARNNTTWQSLHKADGTISEEAAKERYDYIFNSTNANDEFIAHGTTNPGFMRAIAGIRLKDERGKGLFNAIKDFFSDLMNAVMGNYQFTHKNALLSDEIHTLAFRLAEVNGKAADNVASGNMFSNLSDFVSRIEGSFEEFAHSLVDKVDSTSNVKLPDNMTHMQEVLFVGKTLVKSLYNKNYRYVLGKMFSDYGVGTDSSIREVIRSVIPKLDDDMAVQFLGLKTSSIGASRNLLVGNVAASITDGFTKQLAESEEEALTSGLVETNATVLFTKARNSGKGYSKDQLSKLFLDEGYRKRTIGRLGQKIRKHAPDRANWLIGQSEGLGSFMVTGQGHEAQNVNSRNIAVGAGTSEMFAYDKYLLELVEELVALNALDKQDSVKVLTVGNLLKGEETGVRNIVNLYEDFKEESRDKLFTGDVAHVMEGYTRELFDDSIDVRYEALSAESEMKKQGYTLVSTISNKGLAGGTELGFYVSASHFKPERLEGAVSLGSLNSRGLTLKEARFKQFGGQGKHAHVWFENDKMRMDKKAIDIHARLTAGEKFSDIEMGAIPIVDASNNIVDYRTTMLKDSKRRYLKQTMGITQVLSRTMGTLVDKVAREDHNNSALDVIKENVKNVYDRAGNDDLAAYTLVSDKSTDPAIRQLFYMLPKSYQDFARNRADESLPIPSILMQQYFGYAHARTSNLPGINRLPATIKRILDMVEGVYMDAVKLAKGNILLKMPVVLVGNIVSNIMYAFNTGMNPVEIFTAYRDSFRDVKLFMAKQKEFEKNKVELMGLTQGYNTTVFKNEKERSAYSDQVKRLKDGMARLAHEMDESDVKELFDLGMYQAVIEDISMYKLGDTNSISDGMDSLLSKVPTVVKLPLQWAYLSKETAWYKFNQEVLQLSDLVARDVMNRKQKMIEKEQANGVRDLPLEYRKLMGSGSPLRKVLKGDERDNFMELAKRSRQATLLNSFVNYNLPNGKGEEYLNRTGTLMFTKYLKRIQNVITQSSIQHPIRTLVTLSAAAFALDADVIQDQAFLVKSMDNNDAGLLGVLPLYTPLDVLMNVVTPAIVKFH